MMENHIVIYLHASDESEGIVASWIILDKTGKIIQSIARGDLSQFSATKNSDIYIVVPAEDTLITSVNLPKLSRQKIIARTPFRY